MSAERWSELIVRIGSPAPDPIDTVGAAYGEQAPREGDEVFPHIDGLLMPQTALTRPDAVTVGFRVSEPLPDLADRALRLAAFALEQDAEVVILSHIEESGFERFGFRVERIAGATPEARAACEDQIRRFWNIDLVL